LTRRRTLLLAILCVYLGLATAVLRAEVFRVSVTRVDRDLYRIEGNNPKLYIETRYCYEYANRDDAVLRYERYAYDNKLIFSGGTTCDVKGLR
jgi:hypothetical protein